MPNPTEKLWKNIAIKYKELWNFPNCIGAIDGKHINIQCPINAGSSFYNYKGNHSIVLLALVDATYKFIAIDVGSYGRNSNGSIFANSALGQKLESNTFNVPKDTPIIENGEPQPYVIVGDEAFPLKSYLLRPYSRHHLGQNEPNKIFNYRLSRARRVSENAFGILAARWRIFRKHLEVQPQMADKVVLAACCLHNLLCEDNTYEGDIEALERPTAGLHGLRLIRQNSTQRAFQVRDYFKEYFNSPDGSVPWQLQIVRRGRLQNNE